ncbi:5-oxoprolinase subunit B family protein [Alteromonas gracilis]|uniref:5-oxoprolinase subunit B family protein n=1 Tax=Alteromonas gracilis TaxID=1479524 RepID=UPI0030CC2740
MQSFGDIRLITPVGADAVILYFNGESLDDANAHCQRWLTLIKQELNAQNGGQTWLKECVPSYDSLMLVFDFEKIDTHGVYAHLVSLAKNAQAIEAQAAHQCGDDIKTIPVWYGAPNASDFSVITKRTSLSIDEIIHLHTSSIFKVYAVGFAPGFAYMGEVPEALACPRLTTPRKHVPKGAVAIADRQTAVYPSVSPGGWNLLGLSPIDMVRHMENKSESLLKAGDRVQFVSITEEEYNAYHEG